MLLSVGWTRWLALAVLAVLLWVARGALPPFIVAGILAYLLSPLADELAERLHIRRQIAALLVCLAVLAALGALVGIAGARLSGELRDLGREGPGIIQTAIDRVTGGQTIDLLGHTITSAELGRRLEAMIATELGTPAQALQAIRVAIDLTLAIVLVILGLVYMLIDGNAFWEYTLQFIPIEHRARVITLSTEIHRVLGRYLRGQLSLIVLMSSVTFVILEWGFHLPYALWIGILTGLLEVVPLIGPLTAAAIACTIGFVQGGPTEVGALALTYFVLRELEDQLIMPLVVGRAVHVHPLVTIFAVLAGERIAGVLGMLLAVPVAAATKVVLDFAYPGAGSGQPRQLTPARAESSETSLREPDRRSQPISGRHVP